MNLKELLEVMARGLVEDKDSVTVTEDEPNEEGITVFHLKVAEDDVGRVIGKRGATAQSIRTLLRALGTKNDARYNLKIVNTDGGKQGTDKISSADDSSEIEDEETSDETEEETSDVAEKTRAELEELDDLDI